LERAALSAAFFLPLPGAKMIWQFGELGYGYSINSRAGSSEISENNRTARKDIRWDYYEIPARKVLYDTYSRLINLRNLYGNAFDNKDYWDMQAGSGNWAAGRRICLDAPDLKMVIVGNFNVSGTANTKPDFPVTGTWYDLITGEKIDVTDKSMTISLAAGKFKVLTNKNIPTGNDVVKENSPTLLQTHDNLTIITEESVIDAKIYNINGMLIKQTRGTNTIPITNLSKGFYILNIRLPEQNITYKFIIK